LWIVGSALFVLAAAFVSYSGIKAEFDAVALQAYIDARGDEIVVPQLCGKARGVAGRDYTTKMGYPVGCPMCTVPDKRGWGPS
jgi:hypothetical protein